MTYWNAPHARDSSIILLPSQANSLWHTTDHTVHDVFWRAPQYRTSKPQWQGSTHYGMRYYHDPAAIDHRNSLTSALSNAPYGHFDQHAPSVHNANIARGDTRTPTLIQPNLPTWLPSHINNVSVVSDAIPFTSPFPTDNAARPNDVIRDLTIRERMMKELLDRRCADQQFAAHHFTRCLMHRVEPGQKQPTEHYSSQLPTRPLSIVHFTNVC